MIYLGNMTKAFYFCPTGKIVSVSSPENGFSPTVIVSRVKTLPYQQQAQSTFVQCHTKNV